MDTVPSLESARRGPGLGGRQFLTFRRFRVSSEKRTDRYGTVYMLTYRTEEQWYIQARQRPAQDLRAIF